MRVKAYGVGSLYIGWSGSSNVFLLRLSFLPRKLKDYCPSIFHGRVRTKKVFFFFFSPLFSILFSWSTSEKKSINQKKVKCNYCSC